MQENNQKNSVLREENLEIAQKLKSLVEQYELREQVGLISDFIFFFWRKPIVTYLLHCF